MPGWAQMKLLATPTSESNCFPNDTRQIHSYLYYRRFKVLFPAQIFAKGEFGERVGRSDFGTLIFADLH